MKKFTYCSRTPSAFRKDPEVSFWIRFLSLLLSLAILILFCLSWKKDWLSRGDLLHIVEGSSMSPSLQDGQLLYSEKRDHFNRMDLVCLAAPEKAETLSDVKAGELLVKRIIGLPGEHLEIESGGRIYIDGTYLWEPYLTEEGREATSMDFFQDAILDVTLPDHTYFVMGDNRGDSLDSRAFGPVPEENMKAAVRTSLTRLVILHFAVLFVLALALPLTFYRVFSRLLGNAVFLMLQKKNSV